MWRFIRLMGKSKPREGLHRSPASHAESPAWLRVLRVLVSISVLVGLGCVILAAGHGIAPLFVLALPGFWENGADVQICAIWGSGSVMLLSHLLSNDSIAAISRLLASACLCAVLLTAIAEFEVYRDREFLLVAIVTAVPFCLALIVEVLLDLVSLWRGHVVRQRWTFTIRDLAVLTVSSVAFVLPLALSR
jgi:hypothetical protein